MSDLLAEDDQSEVMTEAFARVLAPIEHARGLPNEMYTDPQVHARECERVFAEGWACAGFVKDVPAVGDTFPIDYAGMPLVSVRGTNGKVRVFHNVCQHRGRILIPEATSLRNAIVCPYHSWTYDLEGRLIGTPHVGGAGKHTCPRFDADNIHLKDVRSAEWFGLIFVDISGTAADFADFIAPMAERWRDFKDAPLVHTGEDCSISISLNCNWKLAVENYCESYHLPWVHPGLNRYSPLERHHAIVEEGFSGQLSESYQPAFADHAPPFPDAADLSAYWDTGAEYLALYPNVLLGIHRDHFFAVLILPDGPAKTHERFEIFYFDNTVREGRYAPSRAANRTLWQGVFVEDRDAVEGMQRGRHSPGFDGGVFSPAMDPPTHAFHTWIARAWTRRRTSAHLTIE